MNLIRTIKIGSLSILLLLSRNYINAMESEALNLNDIHYIERITNLDGWNIERFVGYDFNNKARVIIKANCKLELLLKVTLVNLQEVDNPRLNVLDLKSEEAKRLFRVLANVYQELVSPEDSSSPRSKLTLPIMDLEVYDGQLNTPKKISRVKEAVA